ncbi:MAG: efflux RND transporter permease subunit [Lachnospiraceae bacterium]
MLSKFSVKKPYTVVVGVVLIIILGIVSFQSMTVDLLPNMNLPYAVVMTTYQGASPEGVETVVTKPIEQTMATVSNIKNVNSTSQENVSTVILEFEQTANMDSVTLEMRERLDQIKGYWPEEVANPMIMKLNPTMMPVMVSAVSMKGDSPVQTSKSIEEKVIPEIESIEGVASVTSTGTIAETVQVTVNPDKVKGENENVRANLDAQFAKASQALEEAKVQVEAGKAELTKGQNEAAAQMGGAETEISKKSAELTQGQLEVSEKTSELEVKEVELNQAETLLGIQQTAIETAITAQRESLASLQEQETTIRENYRQVLETIKTQGETPELLAKKATLEMQIAQLDQGEGQIAKAEAQLVSIQENRQELQAGKEQIKGAKEALGQVKNQLAKGAISLAEARGQMSSAQILAASKLSSANAQAIVGEQQIHGKEAELQSAKEEAYQKADLQEVLTADMVKNMLMAQNFNMPAGYVKEAGLDYLIRVGEKFKSIEDIKNLVLVKMDGVEPITLSDVADVKLVDNSDEVYAKLNGEQGVLLSIQKQTGYSTGEVSKRVAQRFQTLQQENKEVKIITLMDQGVYIDLVAKSVLQNLVYGGILAILVLLLFLKNIRPTFVIACSIPISIMSAIVLMYFSGVTLNVISLSGLALGVGMLVDNSIVVIENIYRMRNEEGASAKTAAIEGARQVSGAIVASTLTTVCVFLPIVFAKGITKQLFVDMGLTIAYSLLASLVVALTIVPMMSAGLLKKTEEKEGRFFHKLLDGYEALLRTALKHKCWVLIGALTLMVLSTVLALSKGTAFMPEMESTQISIKLETKEGTSLADTGKIADQAVEKLRSISDIEDVGAMTAAGGMMGQGTVATNEIELYAIVKENKKLSSKELEKKIQQKTRGLDATVDIQMSNMDMSALGSSGIVVQVKGKDLDTMQKITKEVAVMVSKVEGTKKVSDGMEKTTGELRVMVDKEKAIAHNLTVAQVYQALAVKVGEAKAATILTTDTDDYDIFVVDQKNEELSRETVKNLKISASKPDGTKEEVALSDIAKFENATGLQAISRKDQSRYMNVTAEVKEGENIGIVSNRVKDALKSYQPPKGYEIKMVGEDSTIVDAMTELFKMLALAIVFMYLIMVAQFQSLRSPFIIMFTIPLAFTGGLLGLFLANDPISVIAMVGFVMLSGIIVNNGIVFVDYTNQLIGLGKERQEALVEAGRTRLRPIIMTALTTILGLSTMAIGVGMGADMSQPMAIVTIGGLLYGTFLTLFVVPCIFDLFHKKEKARLKEEIDEWEDIQNTQK